MKRRFLYDHGVGSGTGGDSQVERDRPVANLTYGQRAVGMTFNPSADGEVDKCKSWFAALIDQMNDLRNNTDNQEQKRLASVAITEAQTAQMWAVKALTWKG